MDTIKKVRKFVKAELKKPTSKYGYAPFKFHIELMVSIAKKLAKKYKADAEVVEISAWLHDIGSCIYGRSDHHITGAKIAEKKLKELNYPETKIKLIKKCIQNHRGSVNNKRRTLEEQIIAEADAISNFENIMGPMAAALVYEKLEQDVAKKSIREKLIRKWKQLKFPESKKIAGPKYKAAMLLLK
jgi:uncharacterized protein